MEVSSLLPCKGCNPWQGLLLTASLLTCWHLSTTAQVTIESVPPQVFEGENVLLRANNLPENLLAFSWYKEVRNMNVRIALFALNTNLSVMGPEQSDRETVYSNGSLWLKNVTKKDTGFYTLQTVNRGGKIVSTTTMYFHVYTSLFTCGHPPPSAQPTIESVPPSVAEGGSVLLLVHNLPENLQALYWYKGVIAYKTFEIARHIRQIDSSLQGPAHSGREALFSNGSLLLHNVICEDTGFYTLRTLSTDLKTEVAHVQIQVNTSISTCSTSPTSTQVTIESVPQYVAEGKSVLLLVHNLPEDLQEFYWYKSVYRTDIFKIAEYNRAIDSTIWGLAHSQRETLYTNGSLLIEDITENDAGLYMLETLNKDYKIEKAFVQLHVNKPVTQPLLRVIDTTITVQSSVIFTCFSADTGISIRWIFNNQNLQLTERMTLSSKNCQLSIDPVRREDAGEYKCEVSNPVSSKTSLPVILVVKNE
ncbi:pregnancy-specific glycoprotein 22-like [Onychomys torridus]|uniref:pregnancy-specific glycoprotein 22-like n=1 Tax=Onychomys torridus TaxID=38674 RepID=UPI00167F38DA|nr:pregnancy-specific glycoprotein 22-like [Onychomys torridus]